MGGARGPAPPAGQRHHPALSSAVLAFILCLAQPSAAAKRACEESGYCSVGISKHWVGDISTGARDCHSWGSAAPQPANVHATCAFSRGAGIQRVCSSLSWHLMTSVPIPVCTAVLAALHYSPDSQRIARGSPWGCRGGRMCTCWLAPRRCPAAVYAGGSDVQEGAHSQHFYE